jgi:hypothetical protein
VTDRTKMERSCSTGQSPQWAVVRVEEEELAQDRSDGVFPTHRRHKRSGLRLKCAGTRAENRFRLSAKRTSPFKSAGASVQSTTSSRGVRISGSNGSNAG